MAGYLYAGGRIVAETDAGGNVTERFVYATKANVPSYFIKYNTDGTTPPPTASSPIRWGA